MIMSDLEKNIRLFSLGNPETTLIDILNGIPFDVSNPPDGFISEIKSILRKIGYMPEIKRFAGGGIRTVWVLHHQPQGSHHA